MIARGGFALRRSIQLRFATASALPRHFASSTSLPVDDGCGQWPVGVGRGSKSPGYSGVHDVGGVEALLAARLDTRDRPYDYWERTTHALLVTLIGKRHLSVDQLRRAVEQLHPEHYAAFGYYEKWAAAMAQLSVESGLIESGALADPVRDPPPAKFQVGEAVVVREEDLAASRWQKPHLRVPGYAFGASGVVERVCGAFSDPETLAFSRPGEEVPKQNLYRVRFASAALWPEAAASTDTVDVEIYESWLAAASEPTTHDHDHEDEGPYTPARRLADQLLDALVRDGVVSREELRQAVERLDAIGTQQEGPRLVARAWCDDEFKRLLLRDATAAAGELGVAAVNSTAATVLTAVENTPSVHNLIVCTLCSCYPLSILGLSPPWYKSRVFRARAVREPRRLLSQEFGLAIPDDVAVRVHDSTADLRYIVLPRRPAGTEGWSEEELAALVTRDSMIGTAVCKV